MSKINTDMVVKYLLMSSSPIKGITVQDICSGTGLAKSTVYRIINKVPAIIRVELPGKGSVYWLDPELIVDEKPDKWLAPRLDITRENHDVMNRGQLSKLFTNLYTHAIADKTAEADATILLKGVNTGRLIKTNEDSGSSEQAAEIRAAIGRLMDYGAFLQVVLNRLRKDKRYLSDELLFELLGDE